MVDKSDAEKQWREAIRTLFTNLPSDYTQLRAELKAISHVFHEEVGAALKPAFNKHLQGLPEGDLIAKRKIAAEIGDQLRELRLAIKCPITSRPAILLADPKNAESDLGRFRLEVKVGGGPRRTLTRQVLPELELMEDPPPREGRSRYLRS